MAPAAICRSFRHDIHEHLRFVLIGQRLFILNLHTFHTAAGITLALDKYFPAKPEGFSMTARAAYDESYFYMAVDVMDDALDADYGYGMYGGDCLQIAFSEYGDDYGAEYGFSNYNPFFISIF